MSYRIIKGRVARKASHPQAVIDSEAFVVYRMADTLPVLVDSWQTAEQANHFCQAGNAHEVKHGRKPIYQWVTAPARQQVSHISDGLCPICGERIRLTYDITTDGRLIGTCGDAFRVDQWEADE